MRAILKRFCSRVSYEEALVSSVGLPLPLLSLLHLTTLYAVYVLAQSG